MGGVVPGLAGALIELPQLWSQAEVLPSPSPVPREPRVYAWYFHNARLACRPLTVQSVMRRSRIGTWAEDRSSESARPGKMTCISPVTQYT